jgi:hypothetical protein
MILGSGIDEAMALGLEFKTIVAAERSILTVFTSEC